MASDSELRNNYVIQYQEILQDIRIFGNENPDNIAGYNYLVGMAEKIYERAVNVGFKPLTPVPPKK